MDKTTHSALLPRPVYAGTDPFWRLIDESYAAQPSDEFARADWLVAQLSKRPAAEIEAFHKAFISHMLSAYSWGMTDASFLMFGPGNTTDDSFDYFRCWLIGQGHERFTEAVAGPDSIASWVDEEEASQGFLSWESLRYVGRQAYEAIGKDGDSLQSVEEAEGAVAPSGKDVGEGVYRRYPRLAAKFGRR